MDISLNEVKKNLWAYIKQIDKFTKTIRFKLAFFYSGILFLFTCGLVLTFNVFLSTNLHKDPDPKFIQFFPDNGTQGYIFDDFEALRTDEKNRIRNIRLNDLRKIQQSSVIALLPLAFLSFSAGYYISGRYLDPIGKLKRDIEHLETKDLGVVFNSDSDDEVGALVSSFNDLSMRLKDAFTSQEEFVQNAAHELRTPLTIIQTNLDTVLDNPQATKSELDTAVNQALTGVTQLKKLVNYLLELTMISKREFSKVNVSRILSSSIATYTSVANANGTPIKFSKSTPFKSIIFGEELLLGRVFQNLIENAIKYSTQVKDYKLPIEITQKTTKNEVTICVASYGENIPQDKLPKLFDRFYQVDAARSKKIGGYGLGLSIVKKIVTELNGKVTVKSSQNKNEFTIVFPRISKL